MLASLIQRIDEGFNLLGSDVARAKEIAKSCYEQGVAESNAFVRVKAGLLWANSTGILGNSKEALSMAQEALQLAKDNQWNHEICMANHVLGNTYAKTGQLQEAMGYYEAGLNLAREIEDSYLDRFLNNIAVVYAKNGQLDKSLMFLEECLSRNQDHKQPFRGYLLTNIAEVYLKMGQIDRALQYNQGAELVLNTSETDWIYLIQCEKVYGKIYSELGDWQSGMDHLNRASKICKRIGDQYRLGAIALEIGRLTKAHHDLDEAIASLTEALEMAKDSKADIEAKEAYWLLSECYEEKGQYKESLEALRRYTEINQRLNVKSFEETLAIKSAELEFERRLRIGAMEFERDLAYKTLGHIGRRIASGRDLEAVLQEAYHQFQKELNITTLETYYIGGDGERWYMGLGRNLDFEVSCHINALEASALPIFVLNAMTKKDELVYLHEGQLHGVLLARDMPIGLIVLKNESELWQTTDVQVLDTLVSYFAIALQNAFFARALKVQHETAKALSYTDSLTGLYNRRLLNERLEAIATLSERSKKTYTIGILDIDYFKQVNDTYGHDAGDEVLIQIAVVLKQCLRAYDVIGRWGGEEFLLIFPDTEEEEARRVANRICKGVMVTEIHYGDHLLKMTATIGLADSKGTTNFVEVTKCADAALYQGKQKGRNRVFGHVTL